MTSTEVAGALSADPSRAGIFSDFDGTLARIVDDPSEARPVPGAVDALAALAARYARVGVLSGRPAAFLREHLDGNGLFLSGLYGMEVVAGGVVEPAADAEPWAPVVADEVARARDEVARGLLVEDKGLSFTVHFRQHPELEEEARAWTTGSAARSGLVIRPARLSYELCPPVSRSKGTVLRQASEGLDAVCFVGDDLGDLTAFDTLDELAGAGVTARRIAVASDESPPELMARADTVLDGPEATVSFLRQLVG